MMDPHARAGDAEAAPRRMVQATNDGDPEAPLIRFALNAAVDDFARHSRGIARSGVGAMSRTAAPKLGQSKNVNVLDDGRMRATIAVIGSGYNATGSLLLTATRI